MNNTACTAAAALLGLCLLAPLHAQPAPTADAVLDRYVEVTGGKAAYEKIHNQVTRGTMEFVGKGIHGTIENWEAEPNKNYSIANLEGVGKVESGSDGEVFWERSALTGPRIKSGEERDEILRVSQFNAQLNWHKIYPKAELAGSALVAGDDCYKVVLTPKTGNSSTHFYSKKTGLLLKTSDVHKTQMGDIAAEGSLKDYKKVGDTGILMPFTHISTFAGQEIAVHLDSITLNVDVPKDRFDLPEDIKALVRKSGASNANQ